MVLEMLDQVDTIIVDPKSPSVDMERMKIQFACSKDPLMRKIHIEDLGFIANCIARQRFSHAVPKKQGLGGPDSTRAKKWALYFFSIESTLLMRSGSRVPFTTQDDTNLCQYIASRRPEKDSGGRSGNKLYQDLVNLVRSHFCA